jgi:GNAT superfamily N-acetyltransferase
MHACVELTSVLKNVRPLLFLRENLFERVRRIDNEFPRQERGFDSTFEAYVAGPLAEFVKARSARERIWIAECDGRVIGCVAIVAASETTAQLRWFLVHPAARRQGLGKRLLAEAVAFCRECGYADIILWTESALTVAARLYLAAGFRKTEEKPGRVWGVDLVEEKYELRLQ